MKNNKKIKNPLGSVRLPISRTGGFMKSKKGKGSYNRKVENSVAIFCKGENYDYR